MTVLADTAIRAKDLDEVKALEAKKSAETTQMLQRQKAAVVSDNISAQQIAKSPDSKASEIVRRVPAVTIKDNKFIVVRGLGEPCRRNCWEGDLR